MADKKEKKGRRAYLEDFRQDINGEFVYEGDRYTLEGGNPGKVRARLWIFSGLLAAACVLGGCLPARCMINCVYCILPYVGELIGVFTLLWAMVKLTKAGDELRGYVYEKSVGTLPQRSFVAALFAALGAIGTMLYVILNGLDTPVYTAAYFVLKIIETAAAWLIHKTVLALKWNKN